MMRTILNRVPRNVTAELPDSLRMMIDDLRLNSQLIDEPHSMWYVPVVLIVHDDTTVPRYGVATIVVLRNHGLA